MKKRNTKKTAPKASQSKQDGRGRPPVYTGKLKTHILSLVREYGVAGTQTILRANKGTKAASARNATLIPSPLTICLPTLYRLVAADRVRVPNRKQVTPVPGAKPKVRKNAAKKTSKKKVKK